MFEYKVIYLWAVPNEEPYKGKQLWEYVEIKLNEYAKMGWRLVTVNSNLPDHPIHYTLYLERENNN